MEARDNKIAKKKCVNVSENQSREFFIGESTL